MAGIKRGGEWQACHVDIVVVDREGGAGAQVGGDSIAKIAPHHACARAILQDESQGGGRLPGNGSDDSLRFSIIPPEFIIDCTFVAISDPSD